MRGVAGLGLCVLAAVSHGACRADRPREPSGPRPSVILAVFDTTRFDDWSYLGAERPVTPVLDALAAGAQRFSNAWSLYPVTVPSHVSLFTGHAVLRKKTPPSSPLHDPRYADERSSLFTILGDHGYRTYAFSGNKNLSRESIEALRSVHVSSEEFHARMPEERLRRILTRYGATEADLAGVPDARELVARNTRIIMGNAESVNAAALPHLEAHARDFAGRPYFLFVNYNDAHAPYFPEPPLPAQFVSPGADGFNGDLWDPRQRRKALQLTGKELSRTSAGLSPSDVARARALHLAELAYADHHFGALLGKLETLGLLEDTVIVCVSDHGELFGEYGRMAHAGDRVEELLRVPLFIHFPDPELPGATWDARVDLRDVKPTLLDYLGIEDESSLGRSLMPLVRGEVEALPEPRPSAAGLPEGDENGSENLIEGQGPGPTRKLLERLRELGYVE